MALYENKVALKGFIGKDAVNSTTKQQRARTVVVAGEFHPVNRAVYLVHATRIHRLDRPDALINTGEDD